MYQFGVKFSAVIRADRCRSIPTVSRLLLRPFSRKHTPLKIVTPSAIQCRRGETGLNNVDHSAEYKQTCSCVATEFYALAPAGMGKGGGACLPLESVKDRLASIITFWFAQKQPKSLTNTLHRFKLRLWPGLRL